MGNTNKAVVTNVSTYTHISIVITYIFTDTCHIKQYREFLLDFFLTYTVV